MTPVPVISPWRMVPGAPHPYTARPATAPIAGMPVISSTRPDPITVDPDITRAGGNGTGINYIGGLGLHISIYCAARKAKKAAGNGDG